MGPDETETGGVRIAFPIDSAVMQPVARHPPDGATLKGQTSKESQNDLQGSGQGVTPVCQQTMIAECNAQTYGYKRQHDKGNQAGPTESERSSQNAQVQPDVNRKQRQV